MRVVLQRVSQAEVAVDGRVTGRIGPGAVILLGVAKGDAEADVVGLVTKIAGLRIFADADEKINLGPAESGAEFLVVSQFTLYGNCRKGRRPSFDGAAVPEEGRRLYEAFVVQLRAQGFKVETGEFGAMMKVSLINDGPVTLILESGR